MKKKYIAQKKEHVFQETRHALETEYIWKKKSFEKVGQEGLKVKLQYL